MTDSSSSEGEKPQPQEPTVIQIDPKWCTQPIAMVWWQVVTDIRFSLQSALKEFFDPLRTNDPRADFFAVYRKESEEFDRDYARKYDEDLNTSLIFVSRPILIIYTEHLPQSVSRLVCSLQSAQRSSSTSNQSYNRTRTTRPPPTCGS